MPCISATNGAKIWLFRAPRKLFKTPRNFRSKFCATYHAHHQERRKDGLATLADATGAIEAAVFPQAFARLADSGDGESPLREGAFLVTRGQLSQEATGSKLFVDEVTALGGRAPRVSALAVANLEQRPDEWAGPGSLQQ